MKEIGRGGGDRKLNLLSQALSCQRRSTAALLPIGVKWCQVLRPTKRRAGRIPCVTLCVTEIHRGDEVCVTGKVNSSRRQFTPGNGPSKNLMLYETARP